MPKKSAKGSRRRAWEESESESSAESSDNESEDSDVPLIRRAASARTTKAKGKAKAVVNDDDVDPDQDYEDEYDEEGYLNDKDRDELSKLPLVDRERILAERFEKRQLMRERWERKRLLRGQKPMAQTSARSTRADALERYKAERESARARRKRLAKEWEKEESGSPERPQSPEAAAAAKSYPEPTITLADAESIRLSRDMLERWVHDVFFDENFLGALVRVSLGVNKDSSAPVYRIASIDAVKTGPRSYKLGNTTTNKLLIVRHGGSVRPFRMEFISNSRFTEDEFRRWISASQKAHDEIPDPAYIKERQARIKYALSYVKTEQDIDRLISMRSKESTTNPLQEKAREVLALEAAMHNKAPEEVLQKHRARIAELEHLSSQPTAKLTENLTRLDSINQRNRTANFSTSAADADKASRGPGGKSGETLDPFSRRRCLPAVHNLIGRKLEAKPAAAPGAAAAAPGTAPSAAAAPATAAAGLAKTPAQLSKADAGPDLEAAHSFDFDIDLVQTEVPAPPAALLRKTGAAGGSAAHVGHSVSLDDYRRRKTTAMEI